MGERKKKPLAIRGLPVFKKEHPSALRVVKSCNQKVGTRKKKITSVFLKGILIVRKATRERVREN